MQTQKKVVNGTAELALRSLLFVPGNHPKKIAKVFSYGADAVIIDLEDACAVIDKPKARDTAIAALKKRIKVWVIFESMALILLFALMISKKSSGHGLMGSWCQN